MTCFLFFVVDQASLRPRRVLSYQTNAVSQYSSHAKTNRREQFRYEKPKSGIQNHFISPVDVWSKIGRRDELALLPRLPNIRAANKSGSYRKTIAPVGFNGNKVKRLHSLARRFWRYLAP